MLSFNLQKRFLALWQLHLNSLLIKRCKERTMCFEQRNPLKIVFTENKLQKEKTLSLKLGYGCVSM